MASPASNKLGFNGGRYYSFLNRPVLVDCSFIVDATQGSGIRSLKGSGVQQVYMHTSTTPTVGSPNPASGYALIQLANSYNRYAGGFSGYASPTTGSPVAINGSALTIGSPYIISSIGHAALGTVTIAPVADVAGSLASTWFRLYDAYGNTFILYFQVSGVGAAPVGVSGTLVPVQITAGATAATIGAALVVIIGALTAQQIGNVTAPSGVFSFTASGTTTVTLVSTQTNPYGPLPGGPMDGTIATGFTFASTVFSTNGTCWRGVGLPTGIVPAVGASFIATATGYSTGGGSTGLVLAPGISGISSMEVVGDPNAMIAPIPRGGSPNVGAYVLVQFLAPTSSSVTTLIPTAPASGTVVGMSFVMEAGSILISGE